MTDAQRPAIEITKKVNNGRRSLVIVYWKPFRVWMFGKNIIDRSTSKQMEIVEAELKKSAQQQIKLKTLKDVYKEVIGNGSHTQGSILRYLTIEISKMTRLNLPEQETGNVHFRKEKK